MPWKSSASLWWLSFGAAAVGGLAVWLAQKGPEPGGPAKPVSPASVAKIVKEEDLNTLTLTPEAEQRIGLTVAPIRTKAARRVRMYGGEVTIPTGRSILVSAPLGGTLKSLDGSEPKAGQRVKGGSPVFQLTPLLTPEGKATLSALLAEVDGLVNNAKTQADLTRIALDRARRVLQEGAGSQRQVDEARAAYDLAATARRLILSKVVGDAESGTAAPIPIDAPADGILRTISALPGQTVPSGAPLFEVVDLSTVWVRVPLPVGDMDSVDRSSPAQVGSLAAAPGVGQTPAQPVLAPPSANPLAATIDLFYELRNTDGKLIPGQRLGVTVPLADAHESAVAPWSAVVVDIHGGTWVYQQLALRRYVRRRVSVAYTLGAEAVLAAAPDDGTLIVITGAQELFGAETGFVK